MKTHAEAGTISRDDSALENILDYVSFAMNVCTSYRVTRDFGALLAEYSAEIRARTAYEIWIGAAAGDTGDCLRLGMRMWTGCGAAKDQDGALDWWLRLADPTHPNYLTIVPRPIQAKALACLANAYLERCDLPESTLQIDDFRRASQLADACASFGLVTPIVLMVANKIERIGLRRQAECKFRDLDTTPFEQLEFLWRAADACSSEVAAEDRHRDAKTSKAPNLYQCAAEGCGIQATRVKGLRQCSGNCPPDVKPSYCSKECQRMDWHARHRAVCKPDRGSQPSRRVAPTTTVLPDEIIGEHLRTDEKELTMEFPAPWLPGGAMKVSSTTMSPAFMKGMRDALKNETWKV